jgi:hypothetical protein
MKLTLEGLSRGATLAASFAGIVTLVQFNRSLDFEKDKLAIEMFRDYSKDKRDFDSDKAPSEAHTRAFALTTQYAAETIYRWRRGNPGWEETVRGMIEDNGPALLSVKAWHCQAMDRRYYCTVQQVLKGKLDCDVASTCP